MSEGILYERLGGQEGIRAVVDDFYDRIVADEILGPLFEDANLQYLRETLTEFLCDAAGGPQTYDGPGVRDAHQDVPLEPRHVWRAVSLLGKSLETFDVPEDDAEAVVQTVATHEVDLLAGPED